MKTLRWQAVLVSLSFALLTTLAAAAGSEEFQKALPGRTFRFPEDHGAHPAFRTEWWYYSGHLQSAAGESFGYQLTFFRVGLRKPDPAARSRWRADTVYFAHLAVSDPQRGKFSFREKAQRGALGLAGAEEGRLKVWVEEWRAEARGEEHVLQAENGDLGLELTLTPLKPPVLHGEGGYSRKSATAEVASHYYSITRLATKGRLKVAGRTLEVTGSSWFDREFSTSHLTPEQVGWDWFALQLDDGVEVMLYFLRLKDGRVDQASAGTLVDPQGRGRGLKLTDIRLTPTGNWHSPRSGATYPSGWELLLPQEGYHLLLRPTLPDQELRTGIHAALTYWEGQVAVSGTRQGRPVTGWGYVELTGYAGPLGGRF